MKTFRDRVCCNQCGRGIEKDATGYVEDYILLTKDWGYHSPYDGESHTINLCVDCYKDWTQHFTIPPQVQYANYVWGEII
ncbi:MAG: hypothetical protein FWG38_01135 [Defluviitaleaceae bacterium]|jgi:hypothetical protein|nr:hypothetical protein [Defluviitaleaceae bacterium]